MTRTSRTIDLHEIESTHTGMWILAQYDKGSYEPGRKDRPSGVPHDEGRPLMLADPLNAEENGHVPSRNKLLFLSTQTERGELEKCVSNSSISREKFSELFERCDSLRIDSSDVEYCTHMAWFWESFFGEDLFLEKLVTKPACIVTTGVLRNYRVGDGETVNISDRINAICPQWNVPLLVLTGFGHGVRK